MAKRKSTKLNWGAINATIHDAKATLVQLGAFEAHSRQARCEIGEKLDKIYEAINGYAEDCDNGNK